MSCPQALSGIAIAAIGQREAERALAPLHKLCRLFPTRSSYHKVYGAALIAAGHKNASLALQSFQQAYHLNPQDSELAYLIGGCYLAMARDRLGLASESAADRTQAEAIIRSQEPKRIPLEMIDLWKKETEMARRAEAKEDNATTVDFLHFELAPALRSMKHELN